MRTTEKKKTKITAGTAALVLVGAGAAFAYWTAGGAGTGTAPTGTSVALVAKQTSTLSAMYPGDSPQTLSGNFDNPSDGPIHVNTVTVSIGNITKSGVSVPGCTAADYLLTNATMTVNADVAKGTGVGSWTGAKLQFNNTAANQDACKDAIVNLNYTIS